MFLSRVGTVSLRTTTVGAARVLEYHALWEYWSAGSRTGREATRVSLPKWKWRKDTIPKWKWKGRRKSQLLFVAKC